MLCCSGRNVGLWLSFMTESWLIYEYSFSTIKHNVVQQRDCAHIGLFDSSRAFNPNLNSSFRLNFQLGNYFLRPCTPVTFNIRALGASFPDVFFWIISLSLSVCRSCVSLLEEGSVCCAILEVFKISFLALKGFLFCSAFPFSIESLHIHIYTSYTWQ